MITETSSNTPEKAKRTVLNNRYTLLRRIATGGMAEIFLARQRAHESGFEKDVAIKYLREVYRQDTRIQEMFRDEATIGAYLNHPNVVHSYEFGNHESMPYIAMEYIKGEELCVLARRGVEAGRFLPLEHAVDLMRQAAEGMGHFHAKRGDNGTPLEIVHRDISPSNLLVTQDGVLKIIDFGIARMRGLPGRANETDKLIPGKCNYMSPEQVRGESVDARSDIFALGIVLYEITVGKRLFKGRPEEVIQKITRARIKPPTFVRRQFPAGLEQIVMKCLEIHPEDRYASANDLASDLEEFLRDARLKSGPVRIAQYLDDLRHAETHTPRPELLMAGESWGDHEDLADDAIDFDRTFAPEAPVVGKGTAPEAVVLESAPVAEAGMSSVLEEEEILGPSETLDALREAFPQPADFTPPASTLPPVSETDATRKMSADDLDMPLVDESVTHEDEDILAAAPWTSAAPDKDGELGEQTDVRSFDAPVPVAPKNEVVIVHASVPAKDPVRDTVPSGRDTLPGLGILVAQAEAKVAAEAKPVIEAKPDVVRVTPPPPPNIRVTPVPAFKLTPPPPTRKPEVIVVKPAERKSSQAENVRQTPPGKSMKRQPLPSTPEPHWGASEPFPMPSPLPQVPASAPPGTAEAMAEVARLLEQRRQASLRPAASSELPLLVDATPVPVKTKEVKTPVAVEAEAPKPPRPAGSGRHPRGRASGKHKAPKLNFAAARERALGTSASSTMRSEPSTPTFVPQPKSFPWVIVLGLVGVVAAILLLAFT
jgi:serine/threonine protein kinase